MSDARAATDAEIAGYKRARLLDASVPLHAFGPLLTRISADAARIRELEAAGRTMINAMNHTHERGETFPARVALAAAHLERMLAAAPRP